MCPKLPDLSDLIGVPFLDHGRDPKQGLDCLGLVLVVRQRLGLPMPEFAYPSCHEGQAVADIAATEKASGRWLRVETPEPGDLAAMQTRPELPGTITHFGVYVGQGRVLHAARPNGVLLTRARMLGIYGRLEGYYRWN